MLLHLKNIFLKAGGEAWQVYPLELGLLKMMKVKKTKMKFPLFRTKVKKWDNKSHGFSCSGPTTPIVREMKGWNGAARESQEPPPTVQENHKRDTFCQLPTYNPPFTFLSLGSHNVPMAYFLNAEGSPDLLISFHFPNIYRTFFWLSPSLLTF